MVTEEKNLSGRQTGIHDEQQSCPVNSEEQKHEEVISLEPNPIELQEGFILNESEESDDPDENEETPEAETIPEKTISADYSVYGKEELLNLLDELLANNQIQSIKGNVENIKTNFYKKNRTEIEEKKKLFIESGGEPENFKIDEDPLETKFKYLYKKYKDLKAAYTEKLEKEKQENLKLKYEIIENIKELINSKESINKTYHEFRELQKKWREIGPVPQTEVNRLWQTYHHHVENFYDFIKINQELRDLDLKKNLEEKVKLCERTEELLLETQVLKAFQKLQELHNQWREIGPVPHEKKDEIWERFKQVTATINKKHQEYFDNQKKEQENNLQAKTHICEKSEEILKLLINSPRVWDEKTKELVELQKLWKTIGTVPRKMNTKIFMRFKEACDIFFSNKKDFFKHLKEDQNNNLQLKTELCMQIEGLKESVDWKKTTDEIINLQKKWKEIGSVPNKHSDAIWKRFRTACDYFFNRKDNHFAFIGNQEKENLQLKNELIEKIENFVPCEDNNENINKLKEFQNEWTRIGHVPIKNKDEIQKRFRDAINKQFSSLKIEKSKIEMFQFRNKIESFASEEKSKDKIYLERNKIYDKIKTLENDLNLWENNIGFFAKSKNAESMIRDFKDKIEKAKAEIRQLKEKLRLIDSIHK
ncbi:MAG: DUF349 domain-containing protein [Bacteroidia bacterium]|nr:DUF349 domain-containing protein [Bacteroidia bacterium]